MCIVQQAFFYERPHLQMCLSPLHSRDLLFEIRTYQQMNRNALNRIKINQQNTNKQINIQFPDLQVTVYFLINFKPNQFILQLCCPIKLIIIMKNNQEESYLFSNPVCKQTYNSLPKIYGGTKSNRSIRDSKMKMVISPARHNCLSRHEEKPNQIENLLVRKKYSHTKSRYLSMPKGQKCQKKNCLCNKIHEEDQKTMRKNQSTSLPKKKIKLKALQIAKPDDFESLHKVAMRINTQPNMPRGLASIMEFRGAAQPRLFNQLNNHRLLMREESEQSYINVDIKLNQSPDGKQTKRNANTLDEQTGNKSKLQDINIISRIHRSFTEDIAVGTESYHRQQDSKVQHSSIQHPSSNYSRASAFPKESACVEVQVNLIQDSLEKRSQKDDQPEITHQSSQVKTNVRQKTNMSRYKKLSGARKSKQYISEEQESSEESQDHKQNYKNQQKNLVLSRQSSSELSLSGCNIKGLGKSTTQFMKLNIKQNQVLRSSQAKSIKSNGTFRIPQKSQYINYLKTYKILDKKAFNLKELVKKPLFTIVEQEEGVYFGQYKDQNKVGTGICVTEKQIFEGNYQNNIKVKGCERNIDGIYKGNFLNGKRQGYGTFEWNNGQKFEGNWKNGVKCGFGIWRSPKGDYYEGEWFNNRQQGEGTFKHKNSTYKGQFENFLKHGKGEQSFVNGDRYQGQYKFGKPDGYGKYMWHDGGVYEGNFESGMRCGYGKWIQSNGTVYEGQFKDDFRHGQGKLQSKSGQVFEGTFSLGNQLKGLLYTKQGKVQQIDNTQTI